jgi:hypothetical protein
MKQNLQNTQNFHLGWAAHNGVAAGKRAGWPLSATALKCFDGFVGFVIKGNE